MPENFLYDSKKLEQMNNEQIQRNSRAQILNNDASNEAAQKNPQLVNGFIKADEADVEMQIDSFVEPSD